MRRYLDSGKLVTAALLLVLVGSLARSIEQARWTNGLDVLMPVAVLGVVVGVLLAGSSLGTARAHLAGVLAGMVVVTWQTGSLLPVSDLEESNRFLLVWSRFRQWLGVVIEGGASYDELLFVFTMGAILWFLAYNSAWFVLRYGWVWWALLPTGLVMLVNLGSVLRPNTRPFIAFLLAGMLLMIHTHLTQKRARWEREGLGYENGLAAKFLTFGAALSLVLLALAWQGPSRSLALTARRAFQRVEQPWAQVQDRWENAFAFLYPGGGAGKRGGIGGGFTSFSDSFELGGPLRLGTRTVFHAEEAQPRQYWRAVANDEYTGRGWKVGADSRLAVQMPALRDDKLPEQDARRQFPNENQRRVRQEVTNVLPMGAAVFASDIPVAFDRQAVWRVGAVERKGQLRVDGRLPTDDQVPRASELANLRFEIATAGPQNVLRASLDGVQLAEPTRRRGTSPSTGGEPTAAPTEEAAEERRLRLASRITAQLRSLRDRNITAEYEYVKGKPPVIRYTYFEANEEDLYKVTAAQPIPKGGTYEVWSIMSTPTDEQLIADQKNAKQIPQWVNDRYLQLPPNVSERVRLKALELTQEYDTTHEKAQAIELWLRSSFKYQENIPVPPPDREFVDYFLFELKQGYCTAYASAMAVMLRELDIPSRVVTGFAPGKFDAKLNKYVITEAQAHMWPQVYYETYGWVDYEPTPIRDLVSRAPAIGGGAYTNPGQVGGPSPADRLRENFNEGRFANNGAAAEAARRLPLPVRALLAAVAMLAILALGSYAFSLLRLRGLRGARRQYAKLLQVGALLGLRPALSHTPSEYGARLEGALPRAGGSVRAITNRYVGDVFGKQRRDDSDLTGEWKQVATQAARIVPVRWAGALRRLRVPAPRGRSRRRSG